LPRVNAFTPVIQTVFCVADLLTATLLFAHYWVQPQRALLLVDCLRSFRHLPSQMHIARAF
jgi:hypothetical protein